MSNKLILYHLDISSPARLVRTVAKLLGLELELRNVNLFEREQLSESFKKLNPEHTVPTLVDGDFVIWDSHAICAYLVDKYAKDDKLYPKDLKLRAKCNQRMFFDAASLFVRFRDITIPIYFEGCTKVPQDKVNSIVSGLEILEAFLSTDPFLVGTDLTIADISLGLTVPFLGIYTPITVEKYPKIVAWLKRVSQEIPFFDEMNAKYPEQFGQMIHKKIEENKEKNKETNYSLF